GKRSMLWPSCAIIKSAITKPTDRTVKAALQNSKNGKLSNCRCSAKTETLKAKDLTHEFPRSPRETLAGYVLAARMLDKCRAAIAGTMGEYHFDCPLGRFFFEFAGIIAE